MAVDIAAVDIVAVVDIAAGRTVVAEDIVVDCILGELDYRKGEIDNLGSAGRHISRHIDLGRQAVVRRSVVVTSTLGIAHLYHCK